MKVQIGELAIVYVDNHCNVALHCNDVDNDMLHCNDVDNLLLRTRVFYMIENLKPLELPPFQK